MFCCGCLNTEVKLRLLDESETHDIREFLGLEVCDGYIYKYICWICYVVFVKSIKFKKQCMEARNMVNVARESLNTLHMSNFKQNLTHSKVVLTNVGLETNEDPFLPIKQEIKSEIPDEGILNETSHNVKRNFIEVNVLSKEYVVRNCKEFIEDGKIAPETVLPVTDKELKEEILVKEDIFTEFLDTSQAESVEIDDVGSGTPSNDDTPLEKIKESQNRCVWDRIESGAPARKRTVNVIPQKTKLIKLEETSIDNSPNAELKRVSKSNFKALNESTKIFADSYVDASKSRQIINSAANCYDINKNSPKDKIQAKNMIVQNSKTLTSKVCYDNDENETSDHCFPKIVETIAPSTSLDRNYEGNKTNTYNKRVSESELTCDNQNKCVIGDVCTHNIKQPEEKLYKCDLCDYRCSRIGELNMHTKYKHTKEKNFSCHICQYKCVTKRDLNIHLRKHTGEKPYTCDSCDNRFSQQNQLRRHIMYKHTKEKNFSCHMCQYKCVMKGDLNRHLRKHTEEKPYICNLCDYKFSDKRNLTSHIKCKHTKEKNFSCHICQYKCVTKSNLNVHLRKHTGEKPYACELCDNRFSQQSQLKRHTMYKHTKEKNFSCDMCQYKCVIKEDLNRHLRKHTEEKPYICDLCDYKFSDRDNLRSHIKFKHTKEKNYSCHMCQYKSVTKSNLNVHLRKHTGEKPYACDLCNNRFSQHDQLRRHTMHIHTKEKNFSCHMCQYKCVAKGELNVHLRKHTGEKPYKCEICDFKCSQLANLKSHLITKHNKT